MAGPVKPRATPQGTPSAFDLKAALERRWRQPQRTAAFWTELTVPAPDGDLRLDAVALEWSLQRLWVHGYEIKVSRSDWLRDAKWERYRPYCDTLTLVCPKGLVNRDEMPGDTGLLWYDPATGQLRHRRKPGYDAPGTDTTIIKERILRALARHGADGDGTFPGRYGRYNDAKEYVEQRDAMRSIGARLGTSMAWRLQRLEALQEPRHRRMVEAKAAMFDRLSELLRRHGYGPSPFWEDGPEAQQAAWARLDGELSATVPAGALGRDLDDAIGLLRRARGRLGGA